MPDLETLAIDGRRFSTLEGFYDEVERVLIPGASWGRNLNALNDVLRGGFGTPEEGFVLLWKHAALSRERLGHAETARMLRKSLVTCDQHAQTDLEKELAAAERGEGETVFDILLGILHTHGPGGEEAEDEVHVRLA